MVQRLAQRHSALPRPDQQQGRTILLDGAHTEDSCRSCAQWFSSTATAGPAVGRVLLFAYSGDRDPAVLLSKFAELSGGPVGIDHAVFCPIRSASGSADTVNRTVGDDEQDKHAAAAAAAWRAVADSTVHHEPDVEAALAQACKLGTEVLVTGSLHLVGAVCHAMGLSVEMPEISWVSAAEAIGVQKT